MKTRHQHWHRPRAALSLLLELKSRCLRRGENPCARIRHVSGVDRGTTSLCLLLFSTIEGEMSVADLFVQWHKEAPPTPFTASARSTPLPTQSTPFSSQGLPPRPPKTPLRTPVGPTHPTPAAHLFTPNTSFSPGFGGVSVCFWGSMKFGPPL